MDRRTLLKSLAGIPFIGALFGKSAKATAPVTFRGQRLYFASTLDGQEPIYFSRQDDPNEWMFDNEAAVREVRSIQYNTMLGVVMTDRYGYKKVMIHESIEPMHAEFVERLPDGARVTIMWFIGGLAPHWRVVASDSAMGFGP
jgi:hypothetical protein